MFKVCFKTLVATVAHIILLEWGLEADSNISFNLMISLHIFVVAFPSSTPRIFMSIALLNHFLRSLGILPKRAIHSHCCGSNPQPTIMKCAMHTLKMSVIMLSNIYHVCKKNELQKNGHINEQHLQYY